VDLTVSVVFSVDVSNSVALAVSLAFSFDLAVTVALSVDEAVSPDFFRVLSLFYKKLNSSCSSASDSFYSLGSFLSSLLVNLSKKLNFLGAAAALDFNIAVIPKEDSFFALALASNTSFSFYSN
jgi:hypothetical protein